MTILFIFFERKPFYLPDYSGLCYFGIKILFEAPVYVHLFNWHLD